MVKKLEKKIRIVEAAIDVFFEKSYDEVSISQICKNAKVSNGLFYTHYKNKLEIYHEILEKSVGRLEGVIKNIKGETTSERLESFIKENYISSKKEYKLLKIFREGQYRFIEYETKVRKAYLKALEQVFKRKITNLEYIYIVSGMRYININFNLKDIEKDSKFISKLILNGIFDKTSEVAIDSFDEKDLYSRTLFKSKNLKHKLLEKGEILFGSKGVYDTKVSDLVKNVGGGIGGFYYYFKTKENFLREVVVNNQKILYFFLNDNVNKKRPALEQYIFCLYLFLEYYKNSTYKYQIIREVEFIDSSLLQKFNDEMINFYSNLISQMKYDDYIISHIGHDDYLRKLICYFLMGLPHYMGIEFFFTKKINNEFLFLKKMNIFLTEGVLNLDCQIR